MPKSLLILQPIYQRDATLCSIFPMILFNGFFGQVCVCPHLHCFLNNMLFTWLLLFFSIDSGALEEAQSSPPGELASFFCSVCNYRSAPNTDFLCITKHLSGTYHQQKVIIVLFWVKRIEKPLTSSSLPFCLLLVLFVQNCTPCCL